MHLISYASQGSKGSLMIITLDKIKFMKEGHIVNCQFYIKITVQYSQNMVIFLFYQIIPMSTP